jgi:ring-1,2-phenylacetyl-CoA epoxidase subunit PaaC
VALDHLVPYTQEFWSLSPAETEAVATGTGVDAGAWRQAWDVLVNDALHEATLQRPKDGGHVPRGKEGLHSEHLSQVLGEMQQLARQHPGASW